MLSSGRSVPWPEREVLGEWSVHGAIGVEVVSEDEPRLGVAAPSDDRFHQRRGGARPLGIRWVGTVVHDGRSIARALDLGRLRDVRRDDLHVIGSSADRFGSRLAPVPRALRCRATASPGDQVPRTT